MNPVRTLKFATHQGILAGILLVSICSPFVLAKSKAKSRPDPMQGMVAQTAKFDTSLEIATFHLGVKHTELIKAQRKPILHAQDSLGLLHGGARVFRLQTAQRGGVQLQAQSAKTGRVLQAKVDKNGKPLTGKVAEIARSPLNTTERAGLTFQLDLRKLTAEIAPDIITRMDAQIEEARTRMADNVAREEKEMEPQLVGRKPHPDMPRLPAKVNASGNLSQAVASEMEQSKQKGEGSARRAAREMTVAMAPRGGGPVMPGVKAPIVPLGAGLPPPGSGQRSMTKQSEREMTSELARVNQRTPSAEELNAKLDGAKNRARNIADVVQPGLDAILTHSRALPGKVMPAVPKVTAQGNAQDVVPWDEWHAEFARLARDPILACVSKAKNPSGTNTVQVTVWKDHRIDVRLAKPGNTAFDGAILNAYKMLAGNPALEFPKHSQRSSITFLVDNEHKSAGVPSAVQSQTSHGDKEVIKYHF